MVFAGIVVWQLVGEQRAATERRLIQTAHVQTAALEREMAATIRILQALAQSEPLDLGDLSAFHAEARRVQQSQPAWYNVILFAPDGRELVSVIRPEGYPVRHVTDAASFERIVATRQPAVGRLIRGPLEGPLGVPIRVPVTRDGQLRGVLTAVITPAQFRDALFHDLPAPDESVRTILDPGGSIVACSRTTQPAAGRPQAEPMLERTRGRSEGVYRDTMPDGRRVYVAFSRSAVWGWTAAVTLPVDALDGAPRRSALALAAIGLIAFIISAAGAVVLSRRLTGDIGAAADAAQALADGSGPPIVPSIVTEVRRLGHSLDRSARLLDQRERERDEHVAHAEAARREAEAATRTKDQFLAMLGHELRNPLAPISTALHLLKLRGEHWSRELAIVERQVVHLTRLVDDLMDMSRITRGKVELKPRPIEIHSVVMRATEMTSPLLEQRQHQLTIDVPAAGLVVNGDVDRLAQVFANLLSNAAKYTPRGGHVEVRARRSREDIVIEVADNGTGLAHDLVPHVFDLFVQGPRTTDRREGGLGLGLTLVRNLIALHHGRVHAHSDGPGRGSTFTVHLPAAVARAAAAGAATATAPPASRPRRLLVVDDNVDAAEMLACVLRERHHSVAIAHDGPSAVATAIPFAPDVAVLDIGLPVMDGYEVAAKLREKMGAAVPAIIALTGYGQAHDRDRSRAGGFHDHFVKPVDVEALLHAVDAAADEREARSPASV